MGLDVTAFRRLTPTEKSDADSEDVIGVYYERAFAAQADGIPSHSRFVFEEDFDGIHMSYSGYNAWRAMLSEVMGYGDPAVIWNNPEAFAGQPFVELINFSDCEGVIGPKTSQKLATDFRVYWDKLIKTNDFHFVQVCKIMRDTFWFAANIGFVKFH